MTSAQKQVDETLNRATNALTKRGPDDCAMRVPLDQASAEEKGCRLAIAACDYRSIERRAPALSMTPQTVHMTFNGEIYNYVEI